MSDERILLGMSDDYCETKCEALPVACNSDCPHHTKYKSFTKEQMKEIVARALCADDVMRERYYEMAECVYNALKKHLTKE